MRKLVFQICVSLDGYYEGPGRDLSWHLVDDEFHDFAIDQIHQTSTFLWGRATYGTMYPFWPNAEFDPKSDSREVEIARLFNAMEKVVFSRTLKAVAWENSRLERELDFDKIRQLKRQPGRNIMVGGPTLAAPLASAGLIDEYNIILAPVAIGKGNALFQGIDPALKLRLESTRTFKTGNVLHSYRPG